MQPRSRIVRRLLPALLSMSVLAACGETGRITRSGPAETPTEDGSESSTGSGAVGAASELCAALDAEEIPTGFEASVPAEFRDAAAVIVSFAEVSSTLGDDPSGPAPATESLGALADAMRVDGVGEQLRSMAELADTECADTEGASAVRLLAGAPQIVDAERDDAYCAALDAQISATSGAVGLDPVDPTKVLDFAALGAVAPAAHRASLELLATVMVAENEAEPDDYTAAGGALIGLGIYAEDVCGVSGAGESLFFDGFLLGLGGSATDPSVDDADPDDSSGDSPSANGAVPAPADPAAATAALPAGSGIEFEVVQVDLEEDGEFLASVVVPKGWENDSSFDVAFTPPTTADLGFFTELSVGAGCQGVCEATDWEARLRGDEDYFAQFLGDATIEVDRSPVGSEGGVVVGRTSDGRVKAMVIRWSDSAQRFFDCQVELDNEAVGLLDSMLAACEASRPGWIAVG